VLPIGTSLANRLLRLGDSNGKKVKTSWETAEKEKSFEEKDKAPLYDGQRAYSRHSIKSGSATLSRFSLRTKCHRFRRDLEVAAAAAASVTMLWHFEWSRRSRLWTAGV
jgi:hypothetical protein